MVPGGQAGEMTLGIKFPEGFSPLLWRLGPVLPGFSPTLQDFGVLSWRKIWPQIKPINWVASPIDLA